MNEPDGTDPNDIWHDVYTDDMTDEEMLASLEMAYDRLDSPTTPVHCAATLAGKPVANAAR
jgi:hypothetical protein